jgi:hypothetical protein
MRLTYLIGEPGVGKSTLMRAITDGWLGVEVAKPFAHVDYFPGDCEVVLGVSPLATQLGRDDGPYPGTDRLSMGVLPMALKFVDTLEVPLVLAEGDRLATMKFLGPVSQRFSVTLVRLSATDELLEARRRERGSAQNSTWLKGRATKVARLVDAWTESGGRSITLDASTTPLEQVATLESHGVI